MRNADYPHNLTLIPNTVEKWYFRWADYIELLCLSNVDGEISCRDLAAYVKTGVELVAEDDNEHEIKPAITDKWERRISDFYSILAYRERTMGDFYPFSILEGNILTLKPTLSEKSYFYFFLLFASNTRYFLPYRDLLTKTFECVSEKVIAQILPPGMEVHVFGTSRTDGRYHGNTYERICQMARDIRADVLCKPHHFPGNRAGDGGIDIVAWYPLPDNAPGVPVVFSQCACSVDDWTTKQNEISHSIWEKRLKWTTPYSAFMLVPFSFRNAAGNWDNDDNIRRTLLLDRDRILLLLKDDFTFFVGSDAYRAVRELMNKKVG
ncbi:MAG: hypothetical protein P4N59_04640 [Negativicutes bacterium]|nr:hypothetical protein [Negativicutes bacterium]